MSNILFKAKRTDNQEWVEGYYVQSGEEAYIICEVEERRMDGENTDLLVTEWYRVDPTTLCLYTGLNDQNDTKIWEHDICIINNRYIDEEDGYFRVEWDYEGSKFALCGKGLATDFDDCYGDDIEVVGNIFDNPEFLEEE